MRKTLIMVAAAMVALVLFGFGPRAAADEPAEVTTPVPWVSDLAGKADTLMVKQSDTDWFQATENTPIGEGDMVWQDQGGESEIYIGQGSYLRLAGGSGVQFTKLANDQVRVTVTKGSVVAASAGGPPLLLDVPGQSVVLNAGDRARVDVADNGSTRVTGTGGRVEVDGPRGRFNVEPGQALSADANGDSVQLVRTAQRDAFDQWSDQRDRVLAAAAPPPVAASLPAPAAAEMAASGVWVNDPSYGWVWRPRVVVGWSPYRDGRWVWRPAWGWTWVSYEPWGWYPYHYGRWVLVSGGWVWSPVHIVVTTWSPALVFWIDGPDYIAWQPIPYDVVSVGLFFNLGPSHYDRYIDHRCMTVVRYGDFGRGHYDRYVRPWPGSCGSSCRVVRNPYNDVSRHVNVRYDVRTPRPNGYVPRGHVPTDTRIYAHTRPAAGGNVTKVAKVDYGVHNPATRGNNMVENPRTPTGPNRQPVNNGRLTGNPGNKAGHTTPQPQNGYQYRNNPNINSNHGPQTNTRLPVTYGRDERGNMITTPTAPNNGAHGGNAPRNGNTAPAPHNNGMSSGQRPSTNYGWNPNSNAGGNTNPRPNTGTNVKPAPAPRNYSAPPAKNYGAPSSNNHAAPPANNNKATPRSYNSAPNTTPRASAPRVNSSPSHTAPARSSSASSSHASTSRATASHASSSRSSAPARSSNSSRSSGNSSRGSSHNNRK